MTFTGEQVNTYGPEPSRLFLLDLEFYVDEITFGAGPCGRTEGVLAGRLPDGDEGKPDGRSCYTGSSGGGPPGR